MSETLDGEMRVVLMRLEMCSFGSTQAWNASGGFSGEPDDKVVFQVVRRDDPPFVVYGRRYAGCRTDDQRRACISDATSELEAILVRPTSAKDAPWVSVETVVLQDDIGSEPQIVAYRRGLSVAHVRKIRMRDGRDAESGEKLDGVAARLPASERRLRAAELRDRGLSLRQIALHLRVSAEMVRKDLAA